MTPAEKILWQELRGNKLGVHFRRQQVIAGFIVDFYCHKAALVIEVDGDIHDLQQEDDARRENVLSEMGCGFAAFGMMRLLGMPAVSCFGDDSGVDFDVIFGGGLVGM